MTDPRPSGTGPPKMRPKDEEYHRMLLDIKEHGEDLTSWEETFVNDLVDREVYEYSMAQRGKIRQIHEKRVPA